MAGARATARIGPLTEFGQIMLGVIHERASVFDVSDVRQTSGLQAGAGVDIAVTPRLAARIQVDFRAALSGDTSNAARHLRLAAGLVVSAER
jgi:hypothetical protein